MIQGTLKDQKDKLKFQANNRKYLQDKAKQERENILKSIQEYNLKYPCEFCRDLPHSPETLKFNCDELFGLIVDYENNIAICPKCGKTLVEWDD